MRQDTVWQCKRHENRSSRWINESLCLSHASRSEWLCQKSKEPPDEATSWCIGSHVLQRPLRSRRQGHVWLHGMKGEGYISDPKRARVLQNPTFVHVLIGFASVCPHQPACCTLLMMLREWPSASSDFPCTYSPNPSGSRGMRCCSSLPSSALGAGVGSKYSFLTGVQPFLALSAKTTCGDSNGQLHTILSVPFTLTLQPCKAQISHRRASINKGSGGNAIFVQLERSLWACDAASKGIWPFRRFFF